MKKYLKGYGHYIIYGAPPSILFTVDIHSPAPISLGLVATVVMVFIHYSKVWGEKKGVDSALKMSVFFGSIVFVAISIGFTFVPIWGFVLLFLI